MLNRQYGTPRRAPYRPAVYTSRDVSHATPLLAALADLRSCVQAGRSPLPFRVWKAEDDKAQNILGWIHSRYARSTYAVACNIYTGMKP